MTYHVHCFDCTQNYEQAVDPSPTLCGACGSKRVGVLAEKSPPNLVARSGYDRCKCGCKYYEGDRCVDCGLHVFVGCDRPFTCFICKVGESKDNGVPCCQSCANTYPDDELIRRHNANQRKQDQ